MLTQRNLGHLREVRKSLNKGLQKLELHISRIPKSFKDRLELFFSLIGNEGKLILKDLILRVMNYSSDGIL